MQKTTGTIYICDHCGRKITNPGACSQHEKKCFKNPLNQHPCYDCEHLIVEQKTFFTDDINFGEPYEKECKSFFCKAHNEYMFTFKKREVAKRRGIEVYDPRQGESIQCVEMPSKGTGGCKDYQPTPYL